MRYSALFAKTEKGKGKEDLSINAKLLTRAGFVDQLMSGSYTLLPLGLRVVKKIEQIVREEINAIGAQEILMPLLHPKEIWNETGRWEKAKEIMYQFEKNDKKYALSFTHEEIFLDLVRKHAFSYKDYPIMLYHFSTKFRNELRAKSGVLRGREFLMKDLYSLHVDQKDFEKYYWEVAEAYKKIFKRLGFDDIRITEAGGGEFTKNNSHEFQLLCDCGENTILYCDKCDFTQNEEVATVKKGDKCPKGDGTIKVSNSIEMGNIFTFGQEYCKKMNVKFADGKGEEIYPYFGSYGIGLTRAMGAIVEVHNDDRGIIWPESVAPYQAHLIGLNSKADKIYQELEKAGIEVLFDDRDVSAGQKFADADLIGIPVRLVVSDKTGEKIEFKKRTEEKVELINVEELLKRAK